MIEDYGGLELRLLTLNSKLLSLLVDLDGAVVVGAFAGSRDIMYLFIYCFIYLFFIEMVCGHGSIRFRCW